MKPSRSKIYLVFSEHGECDDYCSYNICAFDNREIAAEFCASISRELITELTKEDWTRDFDKFNFPENFVLDLRNWYESDGFPKFEIEEVPWNPTKKEES